MRYLRNSFLGLFVLMTFIISSEVFARPPANKIERFFDRNKNKSIDWYEQQLIITHSIYQWELADSKKKKAFDYNQDMMLTPYEYQKYRDSKHSKTPKKL